MKRVLIFISLFFILFAVSTAVATYEVENRNSGIFYAAIQEAINNASAGDLIYCNATTFTENVRLNKTVTLQGAGPGLTIINGSGSETTVNISVNGANLSNFTITGGDPCGVGLGYSQGVTIENCTIWDNAVYGIGTIQGNASTNTDFLVVRNVNVSTNGDITATGFNIYIHNGDEMIFNNVTFSTPRTIDVPTDHGYGIYLHDCNYYNITYCNAHIDYVGSHPNETLNYLDNCHYGNVSHSNFSGGWQYGIITQFTHDVEFYMNVFEHDEYGIYGESDDLIFINNTFINCTTYGLWRNSGDRNRMFYNSFINCTGGDNGAGGMWNSTEGRGNYHSAYDNATENAFDNDSDGIADSGYTLPGATSVDNFPLMYPMGTGLILSDISIVNTSLNITMSINVIIPFSSTTLYWRSNYTGDWVTYTTYSANTGTHWYNYSGYADFLYYWEVNTTEEETSDVNFSTKEATMSDLYNLVYEQSEDNEVVLSVGLILFLLWMFLVFALMKVSYRYLVISLILGLTQFVLVGVVFTQGWYAEVIDMWMIASFGFLSLGIYKTFKGLRGE